MPLNAPLSPLTGQPSRQKVLLYGQAGDGKSYATFTVPNLLQQCGHPGQVFILDTDNGAMRTYEKSFCHLKNVRLFEAFDWNEYTTALTQILQQADPLRGDWIVSDLYDKVWDWAQDHFTNQIFSKGADEFFMEARKRMVETKSNNSSPFEGFKDWPVIKKLHNEQRDRLILRSKCNVICCAKASTVNEKLDSESILSKYGRIGMKPGGQKGDDHEFHTVLFMQQKKNGRNTEYWMRSAKFRGNNSQGIECQVNPVCLPDGTFAGGWAWQYLNGYEGWTIS